MREEIEKNKMETEPVAKVMLTMGIPMILSMALQACYNIVDSMFVARMPDADGIAHVGELAVTAYGIFYKIQQFLFFAGFGLRDAITPLVSFNYGRGNQKRVKEGITYGLLYISVMMLVGTVVLEIFAEPLVGLFALSGETTALCALAVRIISAGFLFAGGNIALQGVFQALGCGLSSLVTSLLRLCVLVLPVAWLFTKTSEPLFWIWFTFPIAEAGALAVSAFLMVRANRGVIKKMGS